MFVSLIDQFRARTLNPAIDQRMNEVGQAMKAESIRLCPVDSGHLRSTINYTYNQSTKTVVLAADASYSLFVEMGTRHQAAQPFLRPAMSVVPKLWRGGVGSAISGYSVNVSAPNTPAKYHSQILAHSKGKIGHARLLVGHGKFA